MFELFAVWRKRESEPERFLEHVRVYSLPDARIWSNKDRILCGANWKQQHDDLKELIRKHPESAGSRAPRDLQLMGYFYLDVADILATIADTVHPHKIENLDKLKEYWFAK
jgi:hypothetical protein